MKNNIRLAGLIVCGLIMIIGSPAVVAAQGAQVGAGLGIGTVPDYEGSDDYEIYPLPYLDVRWENQMSVNWVGSKAKVNLLPHTMWKAGVVGEFIPERADVESDAVDAMEDVDASFMLGAFVGVEINQWSVGIEAMTDVADGNDGNILRLLGGYRIPMEGLTIGLQGFLTWADDDYMDAYFGVDAGDSARSGLAMYDAESGLKDIGLRVSANWSPWEKWSLMGIASAKRLLNDAEDSPVVDKEGDENQFIVGGLLMYKF